MRPITIAIFYSLLESSDVVQLNPLGWLTDVLGRLRDNMDEEELHNFCHTNKKIPGITSGFFINYRTV